MPGVRGRSGRKRKPTSLHLLEGSYRKDRHGDRLDSVSAVGEPIKPDDLSPMQSSLWDSVVDSFPKGVLGAIDSELLLGMVQWYEMFDTAMQSLKADPLNRDAMATAKMAWGHFSKVAAEFGMTPAARARLRVPRKQEKDDPLAAVLAKKARAL